MSVQADEIRTIRNREASRIGLPAIIFLTAVFVKQFYMFSSGVIQLADVLFALSFMCVFVSLGLQFKIDRKDFPLIAFIVFVIIINVLHGAVTAESGFFRVTIYYIFNIIIVITFRQLIESKAFLKRFVQVLIFALVLQLLIYVAGIGRNYDANRYMGTFNDPNQFAFFVFSAYTLIQIAAYKISFKPRFDILVDIIALALVIVSSSTGILLGMAVLLIGKHFVLPVFRDHKIRVIRLLFTLILIVFAAFVIYSLGSIGDFGGASIQTIIGRVTSKLAKLSNLSLSGSYSDSILYDRQIDKIVRYPQYLIYGAGEGNIDRFTLSYSNSEIHSTILGIFFYYGFVPFLFFILWIVRNLKNHASGIVGVSAVAILLEALTLANQRQPFFWMIFVLCGHDGCTSENIIGSNRSSRPLGVSESANDA